MELYSLISYARQNRCSDLHITAGTAVAVRKFGQLYILQDQIPTLEESEEMIMTLLDDDARKMVADGYDVDVSATDEYGNRIRANIYHQRNNIAASIRLIEGDIPTLEQLGMPPIVKSFVEAKSGLVLITGPTGSGKSTTLASMINLINKTQSKHVMTIEDPIEYVYKYDKAMIHQRQLGKDVKSFADALRSSLREDPDIIMVGEMRDFETINAAITAAETGHLVLSTLHTKSAAQTVERITSSCPIETQQSLVAQLSSVLVGVVTQELIPEINGNGRVAATEILVNNNAASNLIKEKKINQINTVLQSGGQQGMHTMNKSLLNLVREGRISKNEAIKHSNNIPELEKLFTGGSI